MIKLFLWFSIGLFFLSCTNDAINTSANNEAFVDMEIVQKVANNFASKKAHNIYFSKPQDISNEATMRESAFSEKEVESVVPILNENSETIYYVVNYVGGGFLLLAADYRSEPTLAYSETNTFPTDVDNYPEGLEYWMSFAKGMINEIREEELASSDEIDNEWNFLIDPDNPFGDIVGPGDGDDTGGGTNGSGSDECDPDVTYYGPLLTTKWNQFGAFNDEMPTINCWDGNALAGCAPIAIAQTMNYFEYPTTYNWSDMPNLVGTSTTAGLIGDIWEAIPYQNKGYDCTNGTGVTASYDIASLLENTFNYTAASQDFYHEGDDNDNNGYETDIIRNNLSNNKPVILSGSGHAWVCDGVKTQLNYHLVNGDCVPLFTTTKLHMNWGWAGTFDSWYNFNSFNPGTSSYNDDIRMVYNINP